MTLALPPTPPAPLRLVHDASATTTGLVPPWAEAAERSVLSAVLLDPSAMPKVIDFLRADHFYPEAHRRIFEACVWLSREKHPIDLTTVHTWLSDRKRLAQVGGAGYIAEVAESSPAVMNVRAHAVSVHDSWRRRQVIAICQQQAAQGYISVADVQAWCDQATRSIATIGIQNPARPIESNDQALTRILQEAFELPGEATAEKRMTGFPTGIHGIDRLIGGLRRKAKTTVAATTGGGKSTFAAQASIALAKQGVGVVFFSMELERHEILRRALSSESGIPAHRIRDHRLSPADRTTLLASKRQLDVLPWLIDDTARLTIEEVSAAAKAAAERMLHEYRVPLGMVVLDYIQRTEPSAHMLRREKHEQIGHATRSFKILCQELDVVGLELAQAKDGPPGKKPERPRASTGIADSSQIAKESDDVIFLVPDGSARDGDPRVEVEAVVAKQRAGAKGSVRLMFRGDIYRFTDPNTPAASSNPSRQYVDDNPLTDGL